MESVKLVMVEDDESVLEIMKLYLIREGFSVYTASNARDGLKLIHSIIPDCLLLDIKLPEQSGFDLARVYRNISDGILIFISGEKEKDKIMEGFEIGCDDYITKPYHPQEVIARVKANIRRLTKQPERKLLTIGNLTTNLQDLSVFKNGQPIELFTKERMLLFYLIKHANQVFSAEHLYDVLWGMDANSDIKTVSVHISTLRKKIEDDPSQPKYILTVRGFGYKFSTKVN